MRSGTLLFHVSLFRPRIFRKLDFVDEVNNASVVRTETVDNAKEMTSRNFLVRNVKIKWTLFTSQKEPTASSLLFLFMVLKHVTLVRKLRISAVPNP